MVGTALPDVTRLLRAVSGVGALMGLGTLAAAIMLWTLPRDQAA